MSNVSSFNKIFIIAIFFVLLLGLSKSNAQFLITSTSPFHGATNVDTAATLSITFNSPFDTTARFPYPGDFFISLYFEPDSLVGEPDSFSYSQDMQTIYIHNLHLEQSTVYRFIINDAVSQSGDSLEIPFAFTFTTGLAMPSTATVSGNINYPGDDPTGAVTVLFDGNPFESDGEVTSQFWSVVPGTSGYYNISYVDSGYYWPFVVKNFLIDEAGELELQSESSLGFLDNDGDNRPDSIYVPPHAGITNININMVDAYYQTARDPLTDLQLLAQAWSADAQLVQLGGDDLNQDGEGLFWQYEFYSQSLMQHSFWFTIGDLHTTVKPDSMEADTMALPQNWLNSDTVLAIAEDHGGSDFRQQYSDAQVSGQCGYFRFDDEKNKHFIDKNINTSPNSSFSLDFSNFKTTPLFQMPVVWGISYYSDSADADTFYLIDALDGSMLTDPTTASAAEQLAYPIAQNWMPDAKLWGVGSHWSHVDSTGTSEIWACLYYSKSVDSLHGVFVWGKIPLDMGWPGWTPPDTISIPTGWLDSDVCIAVAEDSGGADYRMNNLNVFVSANLGRHYYGGESYLDNVWEFLYTSATQGPLEILVDPYTGNIINSLDNPDDIKLPEKFTLYQNYPNPFNPETTISFDLPEYSEVDIDIYNLLGQKVANLLDKKMKAGNHKIFWNAKDFASGIYLYKITAGDYTGIKKCILLK